MKKKIFNNYAKEIAESFCITEEELFSNSIKRKYTVPRHMLFLLCHERKMTSTDIAECMRENGSTALHAGIIKGINSINSIIGMDEDFDDTFNQIQKKCKN
jgi:chromosomal replication initiation ATPase DnaA|tara:strand:- start:9268 stop:9570 length:303 start_codon:yes stop_codon:yes gene_type:complete